MKRILLPTDFSETANNAFLYALHLAKGLEAEIFVLHTFERPTISSLQGVSVNHHEDVFLNIEESLINHFKDEFSKMQQIASDYKLEDVKIEFKLEKGSLLPIIDEFIIRKDIDLIVMGTSEKSGFAKKFWGGSTSAAIQSMKTPILSIPHFAKFQNIKTIGLATTFKENDKVLLNDILKSANYFEGTVKCLHVIEYSGNMDKKEQFANCNIKKWKEEFQSNRLDFIVEKSDTVKEAVVKFAKNEHINILVVVKRNLNFVDSLFNSSLSKDLSSHLNLPLMIIKEPEA